MSHRKIRVRDRHADRSRREQARALGHVLVTLGREQRAPAACAQSFRLRCRRCGQAFVEMLALVQHACIPTSGDTAP